MGGSEAAGCPLASLYTSRNLFVQRKTGTLSYGDDPTGVRSILSRAFTPQVRPSTCTSKHATAKCIELNHWPRHIPLVKL